MGVGQKDGGQILQRQSQLPEGASDAAAGDAGIHQQAGAFTAYQNRVAGGPAGQCMYGGQTRYLAVCRCENREKETGVRPGERRLRSPSSSADAMDTQVIKGKRLSRYGLFAPRLPQAPPRSGCRRPGGGASG